MAGRTLIEKGLTLKFLFTVGINDLGDVLEELCGVSLHWYGVGLRLGLLPGTLDNIKHLDPHTSMREMLACWLRGTNPLPTWEALADALESHTIREAKLAEQLRSKYCVSIPGMSMGHA